MRSPRSSVTQSFAGKPAISWFNEYVQLVHEHARFLIRCHRRWAAWRILECAGIGVACGAAFGFVVLSVLLLRGHELLTPAMILLCVGAVAGGVAGAIRRPTLLQTAMRVDRELKLNDLLSAAITSKAGDPFIDMVRAQAEAVCRMLSPNDLILQRLGARVWGGIGIAASLLLTLAMIFTPSMASQATAEAKQPVQLQSNRPIEVVNESQTKTDSLVSAQRREDEQRDASRREDQADFRSQAENSNGSRSTQRTVIIADAAGLSSGRTNDAVVPRLNPAQANSPAASSGQEFFNSGGDGIGAVVSNSLQPASQGRVQAGVHPVAPWQSATWAADRAEAQKDIQSGKTPDEYRTFVQEYFNRQP